MRSMPASELSQWGRDSLMLAVRVTSERALSVYRLLESVARGAYEEFKRFFTALFAGELSTYFRDACKRLWDTLRDTWEWVKLQTASTVQFLRSLPSASTRELTEHGVALLGAIAGFVVIGGRGDGGMIDKDLAVFGIGGHRSIYFHSVFIGLAGEVVIRAGFDLIERMVKYLPQPHLAVWKRWLRLGRIWRDAMVTGTWVGVATHLTIDSHIDGWTPYKDLPISLSNGGHHLIMDMNAATGGWFAWQWQDKLRRPLRGRPKIGPPMNGGQVLPALKG